MKLKTLALATALLAGTALSAHAAVTGSQAFSDDAATSVVGGDINTGTMFTIGELRSTLSQSGLFVGMGHQDLGTVSFDTTDPTSLTFGNSVFGTFDSTSFTTLSEVDGAITFYVLGDWTPGTYGGVAAGSYASSFTISLNQNPAHTGAISFGGTFSVPPALQPGVPELSTWAMMGVGFAGLAFAGYRSSRKSVSIAA